MMIDNLPNAIWVWQKPGLGFTHRLWEPLTEAPSESPGDAYVPQSELTTAQARITELEAQLKMVLSREAEIYKRHDAKVEKLEHDLRMADRLSDSVNKLSDDKKWYITDFGVKEPLESAVIKWALIVGHNSVYLSEKAVK